MSGTRDSSSQLVVISHVVHVFHILTVLPCIIFEGRAQNRYFIPRLNSVLLSCHDERFIIVVMDNRLLLERDHTMDEPLYPDLSKDSMSILNNAGCQTVSATE